LQQAIDSGFAGQIVAIYDEEDGNHVKIFIE